MDSQDLSQIPALTNLVNKLRTVTIGPFEVSIAILLIPIIASASVLAATYLWTTRTITVSVEEPLSITDCPTTMHLHPGENKTIDITIQNLATTNYSVRLNFALNNTAYQEAYVTFSNHTYNITPSTNQIKAWIVVDKKAPPVNVELTVEFYRE